MKIFTTNGGKERNILPINDADIARLNATPNLPVLVINDSRLYK